MVLIFFSHIGFTQFWDINGNVSIGQTTKNYFTVNENGNVGVGTDEPGAKLRN
ncbi:MAG: hypothetical protein PHW82_04975 [Bacteroidales bacterium]|nr:hypothetical protein [Bacteroidales bacterium]